MIGWLSIAFANPVWDAVEQARVQEVAPLAVEERVAWRDVSAELVRHGPSGALPDDLEARARALGATLTETDGTWVLASTRGWGVLAVRRGAASSAVIRASHPWFDLNTGRIAARLFAGSDARAVLIATSHRKVLDDAHTPDGGLHAATLAVTSALHDPWIVDLHGFGDGHTAADIVVGGWSADRLALGIGDALNVHATTGVAVPSLAGRGNATVKALMGTVPVAHLELSKSMRDVLLESEPRRTALWTALGEGLAPR